MGRGEMVDPGASEKADFSVSGENQTDGQSRSAPGTKGRIGSDLRRHARKRTLRLEKIRQDGG